MSDTEEETMITLNIKSTTNTHDVTVKESATVSEVKDAILAKVTASKEQLCLIFSGKILMDHETLKSHKIGDKMAIHLVIRQTNTNTSSASVPSAPSVNTPAQSAPAPASQPAAASMFGAVQGQGAGNVQGMAQQMMSNPDMMRPDNPIMQNMMSNPDVMRSLLANNPRIQSIVERNPEVGHILNDPDVMRQTMEMIRNPNMFQEMMRSHDLAIRNLQGIPGGEAALQRLYQDVQEPLLNSATGSLGGNPYSSTPDTDDATSRSQRAGVENSEALPNPWGAAAGTGRQTAAGGASETPTGAAPGTNAGGASPFAGMMGTPGMDSLMQQMMSDPNMMQQDDEASSEVVMGSITWFKKKNKEKPKTTNNFLQQHLIDCDCGEGRGMRGIHLFFLLYLIRELNPNRKKLEGFRLNAEIREDQTCGFTMTKDFYQVVRLGKRTKCHAGLLTYHQKSRLIVIYDSDLSRVNITQRAKELYTPWVRAVFGRHFADTIPVYFNVGFELQPEEWSCAFRSIAGLLALLQGQSPCGAVNIDEVVRFVKRVSCLKKLGWKDLTSLEWRMEPTRPIPKYAPSAAHPNLVRVDFPNRLTSSDRIELV